MSLRVKKNILSKNKFNDNHIFCWKNMVENSEYAEFERGRGNRQRQNNSVSRTVRKKGTATPQGWCWKSRTWAASSAAMFLEAPNYGNSQTWEWVNWTASSQSSANKSVPSLSYHKIKQGIWSLRVKGHTAYSTLQFFTSVNTDFKSFTPDLSYPSFGASAMT